MRNRRTPWEALRSKLRGPARRDVMHPYADNSEFTDDYDRAAHLSNQSMELLGRFRRTGDPRDLEGALAAGRAALRAAPEDFPYRARVLSNLGLVMESRFQQDGLLETLNESIELLRAALRTVPDHAPELGALQYNLGNSLWRRADRTGNTGDLDEAIGAYRDAVRATPEDHPNRVSRMANFGTALKNWFELTGDAGALDEAVELLRAALHGSGDAADRCTSLLGLGLTLQARYQHSKDSDDLDEAIELLRAALRDSPDSSLLQVVCLSNLSSVLMTHFRRTWELRALEEAVKVGRAAVRAAPGKDSNPSVTLTNLSHALVLLFEQTGDANALNEAIQLGRAALRVLPDDHPQLTNSLSHLGHAHKLRYEHTGTAVDRSEALSLWQRAAECHAASASARIEAAHAAGRLAMSSPSPDSPESSEFSDLGRAAEILEQAVLLLPEVAPRRLQRGDQQQALVKTHQLAADATALVLADTRTDPTQRAVRALSLAEAGHAVLLSQALDTRSDLSELRERHPGLARRLNELRDLLDQGNATEAALTGPGPAGAGTGGGLGRGRGTERHQLAAELDTLLNRIRDCEGFADFGRPPALEDLLPEALHGPVVTFNVNRYRSDALLLTRNGVISCPLPDLTVNSTLDQADALYRALDEVSAPDGDRIAAQRTLHQILEWLWDAAAEPVLAALTDLGELPDPHKDAHKDSHQNGDPLPRVWWTLTGPLGLLPLHAAGYHRDSAGHGAHRRTVMDRVISSYTPTIRALRHTRRHRRPHRSTDALQSLIVAMPTTPGLNAPLRHVLEETHRIQAHLPHPILLTEPTTATPANTTTPTDAPTTTGVLAHLPHCAIAHFACHGITNSMDPSQSRLLLHDHVTAPLTVSALAQLDLGHGQLAYLSACSTAAPGNRMLLDEAIHLTSACQLAGFAHVIGTLWSINDRLAVNIAESFYTYLATGPTGELDPDQAATALHRTMREVRDKYPALPSLWAAYLHVGA